jgi:hypothetical protein
MATRRKRRHATDPSEPRDPYAREFGRLPPENVAEALDRARRHGRAAASEALAAVQALIEAASLATRGRPSETSRLLGPLAKLLEGMSNELGGESGAMTSPILEAIAAAIDAEISVWQERARDDAEARTVLRAFLGLREVLWEIGIRRAAEAPEPGSRRAARPFRQRESEAPEPRIQRVPVQG